MSSYPDNWPPKKAIRSRQAASATPPAEKASPRHADPAPDSVSLLAYKERITAIRSFVQALQEIAPIVELTTNRGTPDGEIKGELGRLLSLQGSLVNLIQREWQLDSKDQHDRFVLALIAREVSSLIGSGAISDIGDSERLASTLGLIDEFMVERPYIGEPIKDKLLSEDILVMVKLALFPATLRFDRILEQLGLTQETRFRWLSWHQDLTVNLAKDLAFNWDAKATFKDREKLFEGALAHCAAIAQDAWVAGFAKQAPTEFSGLDDIALMSRMQDFEAAVIACDMGYMNHQEYDVSWLKTEFLTHMRARINPIAKIGFPTPVTHALQAVLITAMQANSSRAWEIASTKAIDNIAALLETMTPEEQQSWADSEGAKPMPFGFFVAELDHIISGADLCAGIDQNAVVSDAKGRLAVLWGLSDAICKVRRKDH